MAGAGSSCVIFFTAGGWGEAAERVTGLACQVAAPGLCFPTRCQSAGARMCGVSRECACVWSCTGLSYVVYIWGAGVAWCAYSHVHGFIWEGHSSLLCSRQGGCACSCRDVQPGATQEALCVALDVQAG